MTRLARFVPLVVAALLLALARSSSAQEPLSPPPSLPPAAPATFALPGGYLCVLGAHDGLPEEDARTAADILCSALATGHAAPGTYDTRFGKLGDKVLVVVTAHVTGEERRLLLQGVDEVPVASERIALAFAEHASVGGTLGPERVVSAESLPPRTKSVLPGVYLGTTAMTAAGVGATPSGGLDLAIQMQLRSITLVLQGRAGGIGSARDKLGYASLGAGARYSFGHGDIAPFVGGGLGFAYFQANRDHADALEGSGLEGYAEAGVSFFRSSRAGLLVSARTDLPVFTLGAYSGGSSEARPDAARYVVPASLNLGLCFQ